MSSSATRSAGTLFAIFSSKSGTRIVAKPCACMSANAVAQSSSISACERIFGGSLYGATAERPPLIEVLREALSDVDVS